MLMRKLVDNGQTILCTIHQPSAQIFGKFDRLMFLKDGATVYFGEIGRDAKTITDYFESRGARKCLAGENPAEWLLDITGTHSQNSDSTQAWAEDWHSSQERQAVLEQLSRLEKDTGLAARRESSTPLRENSEFAAPLSQQLFLLIQRVFRDQWRSPTYLYTKTAVCIGLVRTLLRLKIKLTVCRVLSTVFPSTIPTAASKA